MKSFSVLTGELQTKSLKPPSLHTATQQEILEYFENSYTLNEWIFTALKDESSFYLCPDKLRLPLIFYYCHTATVYVNKLILAGLLKKRVNREYELLFETGVDEMSWDDTENYRMGGGFKWPTVREVVEYRMKVREIVREIITSGRHYKLPITQNDPWWAVMMGIEHERIHLETSSVLIRQLPIELVKTPVGWNYATASSGEPVKDNSFVRIPSSKYTLGKDLDNPEWGWDNEYGKLAEKVPEFLVTKYKVTNREMLEFVNDGGYSNEKLWSASGWKWRSFKGAIHPPFWVSVKEPDSGITKYKLRLMYDEIELPLDWPCEVNFYEAKAYCRWLGDDVRLLTELEHNVIRGLPEYENIKDDPIFCKGGPESYNHNMTFGSSTPVNTYQPNKFGLYDVMGNLWDWCEDHFNGLPGFRTNKYYEDFSAPTFDGKHHLILGGSWVSTGNEASRFARYAFRSHFLQFAGFRCVRSVGQGSIVRMIDTKDFEQNITEIDEKENLPPVGTRVVMTSSTNHCYVTDTDDVTYTLVKEERQDESYIEMEDVIADIGRKYQENMTGNDCKALVIGCRSGSLAFKLAEFCSEVVGVDTSSRILQLANKLKTNKHYFFKPFVKIDSTEKKSVLMEVDQSTETENVEFFQLTWLSMELENFDIVINLMEDRVSCPEAWLLRTKELIQDKKGLGIIMSRTNENFTKHDFNVIATKVLRNNNSEIQLSICN